jgi:GT2 family glycosyltransferase
LPQRVRLDLLVATFRRPQLLGRLLESIFDAHRAPGLDVRLIVVNNDPACDLSTLSAAIAAAPLPVVMLEEPHRGKSRALNLGLTVSDADYIGLVDDDERLAPAWFQVAHKALAPGVLDFIGGPMLPIWPSPPPDWLPPGYAAVLGIVDNGPERLRYSTAFPGMLVGGNAIVRRSVLQSIGGFAPELGPQETHRLMSCEDEDVYARLLKAGAQGEYLPELVVYHHVHHDRIRPGYYRSWCFWNGASQAILRRRHPVRVPTIAGIPRYLYGTAFRSMRKWLAAWLPKGGRAARLATELPLWHLAGQLYGRYGLHGHHRGSASAADPRTPSFASSRIDE